MKVYNFERNDKRRVVLRSDKLYQSTTAKVLEAYNGGHSVTYIDSSTKEDLLQALIERSKKPPVPKKIKPDDNNPDFGPREPINKPKYYTCSMCSTKTINRFRCSRCWESSGLEDMGDANYL